MGVILFSFPIVMALLYSVRPIYEGSAIPIWIGKATLGNYKTVFFQERTFFRYLGNSICASSGAVLIALILGVPAAYGFARFSIPGKKHLFTWILTIWMLPPIVVVVPFFLIFKTFGLFDKLTSLIVVYAAVIDLPIVVWIMTQFFQELPTEIEEAAVIDGCGRLRILLSVSLPMSLPGLTATAIFCFIFSWNEFLFARIFTGSLARTLPVAVTEFVTPMGIQWGKMFATLIVILMPVVILILIGSKYLLRGLATMGGLGTK